MHNFTFYWGRKQTKTNFFPRWIYLHLQNKRLLIIAKKFERMQVDFLLKSDVFDRCRSCGTSGWSASRLSVEFWRRGGKREESLQLRLWNFNICIEKVDAKCWLAEMTLVNTSLPLARLFQRLFTFAFVSARANRQKSVNGPKWSPTPNDPQIFSHATSNDPRGIMGVEWENISISGIRLKLFNSVFRLIRNAKVLSYKREIFSKWLIDCTKLFLVILIAWNLLFP